MTKFRYLDATEMRQLPRRIQQCAGILLWLFASANVHAARVDQNCTASIQNRTVQIGKNGTYAIPNVPADVGLYRVRVICKFPDGTTVGGATAMIDMTSAGNDIATSVPELSSAGHEIPARLELVALEDTLTRVGQTLQLTARGIMPNKTAVNMSSRSKGTTYGTSNPAIATVTSEGLVTAVGRGRVIIAARNEGLAGAMTILVDVPNDSDGDGMTDEYERASGLNPFDRTDADQDADGDGLTNLEESKLGTNPKLADTDGDGISDGQESSIGTSPLRADTDGDGIADGVEVRLKTNPLAVDTDNDGLADGVELRLGLDPLVKNAITTVQGRAVDSVGAPVSGASAVVFNEFQATTNSAGFFAIQAVPSTLGQVSVLVQAIRANQVIAGLSPTLQPVENGVTDVGTIQLKVDSGSVSGLVTGITGAPIFGAQVSVTAGGDVRTAVTDISGRYRVTNLVSGALVVSVRDPSTGLRGRGTGTLEANASATVNVALAPSGRINGTVFTRDGKTPVGAGVGVSLSNGIAALTNAFGQYSFDFVNLGVYTIDVADNNGNRGRTSVSLTQTGQTELADVVFLGRGIVKGIVKDGANNAVANASVSLSSRSIFGGAFNTSTDAKGEFSFPGIFVGPFDLGARAPIQRLGGQASGSIEADNQTLTFTVTLTSAGTIAGRVFRSGGTTPVASADVRLSPSGLSAVTDSGGDYRIELVPVGTYTVDASDPSTGDRGSASAVLSTQDETKTANVTFIGQGQVSVVVRDGAGAVVSGARVQLTSQVTGSATQTAETSATGVATFSRVLTGSFSIQATDLVRQLTGSASGSVTANGSATVNVSLQPAGSVSGVVFGPDGVTRLSNVRVIISGARNGSTTTGADGSYSFAIVPAGAITVSAQDSVGNIRASTSVTVAIQGQNVTANMVFIGEGIVTGVVSTQAGAPVPSAAVVIRSRVPGFAQPFATYTDAAGVYRIPNIPVGGFDITAQVTLMSVPYLGVTQGQVTSNGQTATLNVAVIANLVPISTLFDANGFPYQTQNSGALLGGNNDIFRGDDATNRGASILDITVGNVTERVAGAAFGVSEVDGRQFAIEQSGVLGLKVTRKVYVPVDGYFSRHLDLLQNTTTAPLTATVRISSHHRFISKVQNGFTFNREPRVVATSSGDDLLDFSNTNSRDRWVVVDDDEDLDPFLNGNLPAVAEVFDGSGATQNSTAGAYDINFGSNFGRLYTEWRSIVIQPGQTVGLLRFIVQQTGREPARASAARLLTLPPEALTGITAAERTSIRNFNVPASSSVAPLPVITGEINGAVISSDVTVAVPGTSLRFQSSSPFFRRVFTVTSGSDGGFLIAGRLANNNPLPVPLVPFTIDAKHPHTGVDAPTAQGVFASNGASTSVTVQFSNTGIIQGVVRRSAEVVASSGVVQVTGTGISGALSANIAADGGYRIGGLPAGSYALVASIGHPQGTALGGTANTAVVNGQTSTANILITPTGTVSGQVRRGNGDAVVGLNVYLRASNFQRVANTDTSGRFTLPDVPVGSYTLEAVETSTNTAASAGITVAAGSTISQALTLTTGGTVTGLIRNSSNQPLQGAQVVLTASNGSFTTTSDAQGRYTFAQVSPGSLILNVTHSATQLRGRATGSLGLSGQTATIDIALSASGTVTGTVYRADGTTPAANIDIKIYEGTAFNCYYCSYYERGSAKTNAQGQYTFDLVPLGTFTVYAYDSDGDKGRVTNQVNANGETRTINLLMTGLGRVVVTVRSASNQPVASARVTISSTTVFGGSQSGFTQADGAYTAEKVLAGTFTVSAVDSSSNLGGSGSGTLTAGGTANISVQLQPSGTITGRLFGPDGTTPVGAARVQLSSFGEATTSADGSFRFDNVPLGARTLRGYDNSGQLRAQIDNISLSSNGETIVRNLTLIGLATVTGKVTRPNNSAAANISVSLRSSNQTIGGTRSGTTDTQGIYNITGVPVGAFTVTAAIAAEQLLGEKSGQVTSDGQTVTADVVLASNAVNLPLTLYDSNNRTYDIQKAGNLLYGTSYTYYGDGSLNMGAMHLDIASPSGAGRFAGGNIGTLEDNSREVAVRQSGVAGLDVVRKIFVPTTGYFTRYLETLTNPGSSAITVDVKATSNMYAWPNGIQVADTSSGDAVLSAGGTDPDRWVTVTGVESYYTSPTAFIFDGPGATLKASAASFGTTSYYARQLTYEWKSITIPPGGSVSLLHFAVQQLSSAGAKASAERLAQLPPEALSGLNESEIVQIKNFIVPSDGSSSLSQLPSLTGAVTGEVRAGNAAGIPNATVEIKSENPLFARAYNVTSNSQGAFTFTGTLNNNNGSASAFPVGPFTVKAVHPQTSVAVTESGSFTTGQSTATRNVTFSATGQIQGTVKRHNGSALAGISGTVRVSGPITFNVSLSTSGSFAVTGVPPGTYQMTATVASSQGTGLTGAASASISATQTTSVDIALQATGSVTGIVRDGGGTAVPNVQVRLQNNVFGRVTTSNSSGQYALNDVPAGSYTIAAREPNTGLESTDQLNVAADQTTTKDFTLVALGQVQLTVSHASGGPAASANVYVLRAGKASWDWAGSTDASGKLTISSVPAGEYRLRAYNPGLSIYKEVIGTIESHGQVRIQNITLIGLGTVSGVVKSPSGVVSAGSSVSITATDFSRSGQTDSNGNYTLSGVPTDRPLTITASSAMDGYIYGRITGQSFPASATALTANVTLPAIATLAVTTVDSNGAPVSGVSIQVRDAFRSWQRSVGATDAQGKLNVPNMPEGEVLVWASSSGYRSTSATATITQEDDGKSVSVTVRPPTTVTVSGTVFAGDGQTPLPSALVYLYDRSSSSYLTYRYTNSNGTYSVQDLSVGQSGVLIRAYDPSQYVSAERTATAANGAINGDITVPVGVVRGVVYRHDNATRVASPTVYGRIGTGLTRYASTDTQGNFVLFSIGTGTMTLTAQESSTGLVGTADVQIADLAAPVNASVKLQIAGTVTGVVSRANGTPVSGATVAINSTAVTVTRYASTNANGEYTFLNVAPGTLALQARDNSTQVRGAAAATLAGDASVTANITLPQTALLMGTVRRPDGSALSGAFVIVSSTGNGGPLGTYSRNVVANGSGVYTLSEVPVGQVTISAGHASLPLGGILQATIAAGTTNQVNITLGNAVNFNASGYYNLDGTNGFRFDMNSCGVVASGGSADGTLSNAFEGAHSLYSDTVGYLPCSTHARLEQDGRQIVYDAASNSNLTMSRKVYVPVSGKFARFIDAVTNNSSAAITTELYVWGYWGTGSATLESHSAGRYFAVSQGEACCTAALAYGGPNAALGASPDVYDSSYYYQVRWTLTLNPGETKMILSYLVQNAPGSVAAVGQQAVALSNLTDGEALTGVTADEKAKIVNFKVQ